MAIYHLHVKVIGRKSGSSAVASAAYRSGSRLRDERLGRDQDFSDKRGVVHSEVMLPENAPQAWSDRERLWNDVEAFEVRKDAQLAREVEFALPRELSEAQRIELARDFVRREFVGLGMIADLDVHWDMAEDGMPKPHAHAILTMRAVDENGFGQKGTVAGRAGAAAANLSTLWPQPGQYAGGQGQAAAPRQPARLPPFRPSRLWLLPRQDRHPDAESFWL